MDKLQRPMTKFWTMTIKAPEAANISSSDFNALLQEVLDFCYSSSSSTTPSLTGTKSTSTRHEFWEEDVENPNFLVLITGYPTLEDNLEADKCYVSSGFIARMAEWVESGRLLMSIRDVDEAPLDAERIGFEIVEGGIHGQDHEGDRRSTDAWDAVELLRGQEVGQLRVRFVPISRHQTPEDVGSSDDRMRVLRKRL